MKRYHIYSLLLLFSIVLNISHAPYVRAQEACYYYQHAFSEIMQEKKIFEEKIDALTNLPDISTTYIIETGVEYMRIYHAKLLFICNKIITQKQKEGCVLFQEGQQNDYQACLSKVQNELMEQKMIFAQFMIGDAVSKKIRFIVDLYKSLNTKFRDPVDMMIFVKGGVYKLLFNIGKEAAGVQAPEK